MTSYKNKTKDELINDIKNLKKELAEHTSSFDKECQIRGRTEEELRLAQVIIDNSPVVLFRRVAGEKPRLVYVSDNIRQMGYAPEDFIEEKILFREIVHPDDMDRVSEEIKHYTEEDLEEYTQLYRILTSDGRIRWVRQLPRFEDPEDQLGLIHWFGPVLAGDRLILAGTNGIAVSISPYTGEILGELDLPGVPAVSPVVAGNTLYFLTESATLIALR